MIWLILLFPLFLLLAFRLFESFSVFHPRRGLEWNPSMLGLDYEDVFFVSSDDRKLHGWWVPKEGAEAVILLCHGNAGNLGNRIELIASLHALGYTIFAFDYRGYGLSRGWPSEQGTYRDARSAYEVVRSRTQAEGIPPLIVYGRSLGGAVGVQLALDLPVRGLILESTFTSIPAIAKKFYPFLPVRTFGSILYDTLSKIPHVQVPILIAHSRTDGLIPYEMGLALYETAPADSVFLEIEGTHNDSPFDTTPGYAEGMRAFIQHCINP